jgi:hypothetical protein
MTSKKDKGNAKNKDKDENNGYITAGYAEATVSGLV